MVPLAINLKGDEKIETGFHPVKRRADPRATFIMPGVAIKGGILPYEMNVPLMNPILVPMRIVIVIEKRMALPVF